MKDESADCQDESSILTVRSCIEESLDFSQSYQSVTERYYTPYFKLDEDRNRCNDLCLLVHSNRISLVCLAPSHPLVKSQKNITAVDCQVKPNIDRGKNKAIGKSKKGGQILEASSVLCFLEVPTILLII